MFHNSSVLRGESHARHFVYCNSLAQDVYAYDRSTSAPTISNNMSAADDHEIIKVMQPSDENSFTQKSMLSFTHPANHSVHDESSPPHSKEKLGIV